MNGQRIRRLGIWLAAFLCLLACASPLAAAPVAPTQMPAGTIIFQTAAAAQTQTALYVPTITLTPTPTPTFTPTRTPTPTPTLIPPIVLPFLFTETPTGTLTLTPAGTDTSDEDIGDKERKRSGHTPIVDKEWVCTVLHKTPPNDTIIGRGVSFKATWTVYNRGLKVWPNTGVDIVFVVGVRPPGRALYDLPATVPTGGTITLGITLTAPKEPGIYRSLWTLRVGRTSFCKMGINFEVR